MNPRGKRYLITETAKKTTLDETKTEAILDFYWKRVRAFLQNPTETSIFLNKLGTFSLVPYFVDEYIMDKELYIERMDKRLARNEVLSNAQLQYYIRCKNDLIWLKDRKKELKEQKLSIKEKKSKRNEYIQSKNSEECVQETPVSSKESTKDNQGLLENLIQRWED
jgi:hypothetical protein